MWQMLHNALLSLERISDAEFVHIPGTGVKPIFCVQNRLQLHMNVPIPKYTSACTWTALPLSSPHATEIHKMQANLTFLTNSYFFNQSGKECDSQL